MLQNKKIVDSILFILSFEEESTLLYFFDGSIKIYALTVHRFLKKYQEDYDAAIYKRPISMFKEIFIPSCSPRNKNCVWINIQVFRMDTVISHCQNLKKYKVLLILESIYLVYLRIIEQLYIENTQY